ncbi:MAG: polyprenyl diphosphate synthase [Candidatus Methanomethylicaceae archaeon]|jgi:tritrans,polycis-undecaprenyl-diphosphate synthase [geranylgeranyl-diphosphate specific]
MLDYLRGSVSKRVYSYYEARLLSQVKKGDMPTHVGLILDGNRRWASEVGLDISSGHRQGFEKLKDVLRWCWQLGINTVTVYALSTENLNRDSGEVKDLMDLLEKGFTEVLENQEIHDNKVQIKAIGRLDILDEGLRKVIENAEEKTKDYRGRRIYVCVAYGGRAEIVDATKKMLSSVMEGKLKPEEITEDTFSKYLYTAGDQDPDLIIRTSGEERLSGFLLWQSAYSEFYFMDVYWPDLRKIDLLRAVRTYQRRKRRYGK